MNPQDIFDEILIDGLYAKHTHVHPAKAISGLEPSKARERPSSEMHSCWELLHHAEIWQDYTIRMLKGEKMDWREVSKVEWPTEMELEDDDEWPRLVTQFITGIEELEKIVRSTDMTKPVPTWPRGPSGAWVLVALQHNSHHFGQIIAVRIMLDLWPPPTMDDETQ
ncbi:MAG: DinB family protein [Candidatus Thorarchaeota archaeon]|nr:MAG: DinB family protein [Candidatus Thorarchaeota archaeon]